MMQFQSAIFLLIDMIIRASHIGTHGDLWMEFAGGTYGPKRVYGYNCHLGPTGRPEFWLFNFWPHLLFLSFPGIQSLTHSILIVLFGEAHILESKLFKPTISFCISYNSNFISIRVRLNIGFIMIRLLI